MYFGRRALVALILVLLQSVSEFVSLEQVRAPRRWYVRPINQNRDLDSQYQRLVVLLRTIDPERHKNYFRMDRDRYDMLLDWIRPLIKHKTTHRLPVCAETRLSLTIRCSLERFLASGDKFPSLAYNYHLSVAAVRAIIYETCAALCTALSSYLPDPSEELWRQSADGFWKKWNFPNLAGAVDGKHLYIQAPRHSGSRFFNYKHRFSIVLLAVCGPDYRFLYAHIGKPGRFSDSGVLAGSHFGKALDSGKLKLPAPACLPGTIIRFPYVFCGDEGFQLKKHFMRPYPRARIDHSTDTQKIYNYRLSRARRISENCFGILTNRWRVMRDAMLIQPDKAQLVARTCILLHNFLITSETEEKLCATSYVTSEPGDQISHLDSIQPKESNNYKNEAAAARNTLMNYFVSAPGRVPWQNKVVRRGRILRERN